MPGLQVVQRHLQDAAGPSEGIRCERDRGPVTELVKQGSSLARLAYQVIRGQEQAVTGKMAYLPGEVCRRLRRHDEAVEPGRHEEETRPAGVGVAGGEQDCVGTRQIEYPAG